MGEVIFKKDLAVGLPELSKRLTQRLARDKETKGNTVFLRKRYSTQKEKWIHYEQPEISHQLIDRAMKQSTHQFHTKN